MPTAPRYSSAGTVPGPMNAPEVRPALGTAKGLEAIGDTIAGLGRTAAGVMDSREKQAAIAERQAKIKEAADEAAATEAMAKVKARRDAAWDKWQVDAQRTKIPEANAAFEETLSTNPEMDDLSPEQQVVLRKRLDGDDYIRRSLMVNSGAQRMNGFVVETSTAAEKAALSNAVALNVAGDEKGYYEQAQEAWRQRTIRSGVTGEVVDPSKMRSDIQLASIETAMKEKNLERAVAIHQKATRNEWFGESQQRADQMIAPAVDTIWAKDTALALGKQNTTQYTAGGATIHALDYQRMASDAAAIETTPERKEALLKHIAAMGELDAKRRDSIGAEAITGLRAAQNESAAVAQAYVNTPEVQAALKAMPAERRNAFMTSWRNGPTESDPKDLAEVEELYRSGALTPETDFTRYSLSNTHLNKYSEIANKPPEPIDREINKAVENILTRGGEIAWPKATASKPLTAEGKRMYAQRAEYADAFKEMLAADPEMAKALRTATDKQGYIRSHLAVMEENGSFGKDKTQVRDLYKPLTADEDTTENRVRAGVPISGELTPGHRIKVRHQIEADRMQAGPKREEPGFDPFEAIRDADAAIHQWYKSLGVN